MAKRSNESGDDREANKRARMDDVVPASIREELSDGLPPEIWAEVYGWIVQQASVPSDLVDSAAVSRGAVEHVQRALATTYFKLVSEARAELLAAVTARPPKWRGQTSWASAPAFARLRDWVQERRLHAHQRVALGAPEGTVVRVGDAGGAGRFYDADQDSGNVDSLTRWLRSGSATDADATVRKYVASGELATCTYQALWFLFRGTVLARESDDLAKHIERVLANEWTLVWGGGDEQTYQGARILEAWTAADWAGCLVTLLSESRQETNSPGGEVEQNWAIRLILMHAAGLPLDTDPAYRDSVFSRADSDPDSSEVGQPPVFAMFNMWLADAEGAPYLFERYAYGFEAAADNKNKRRLLEAVAIAQEIFAQYSNQPESEAALAALQAL